MASEFMRPNPFPPSRLAPGAELYSTRGRPTPEAPSLSSHFQGVLKKPQIPAWKSFTIPWIVQLCGDACLLVSREATHMGATWGPHP